MARKEGLHKDSFTSKVLKTLKKQGFITSKQAKRKGINNLPDCVYRLKYFEGVDIKTVHPTKKNPNTRYILVGAYGRF